MVPRKEGLILQIMLLGNNIDYVLFIVVMVRGGVKNGESGKTVVSDLLDDLLEVEEIA